MTDTIADFTTTITTDVTTAHMLMDLYKDWIEVYQITGYGEWEVSCIAWLLGLI